jgi:hypothetical protein
MDVTGILITLTAKPLAKFLLKKFLFTSGFAQEVGDELVDIASSKLPTVRDQEKAQRVFADIADHIIQQLAPLFDRAVQRGEANIEAVILELGMTLNSRISVDFFLARDLEPAGLAQAFREARPLPEGQYSAAETSLYERAVDLASRCLVEVASQLPRFDVKLAATQLQRLTRMQDDIGKTLETIGKVEELVTASAPGSRFARFEADYRQILSRTLDHLELFGVDIEPQSRRYKLSVAYISLSLQTGMEGEDDDTLLSAEDVFSQLRPGAGRLLIRGEAGSGKSTLFRWAALRAANPGAFQQAPSSLHDFREKQTGLREDADGKWPLAAGWYSRLPILIRLRDCKNGRLPPIDEFPSQLAKVLEAPPAGWMKSILEQGRALLLLDGIDEVPNRDRQAVYDDIEALVSTYGDCYYILSTRPTAVEKDWLRPLGFREALINPLSHLDRDRLIDRWHDAVAKELERMSRPSAELGLLAEKLKAELRENLPIARLATNPLLAAMICALHRERSQKLPESQAELCEALCHMILHRREREGGLDLSNFPEAYRTLSYPQKKQIVAELAHRMVLNERSVLEREDALYQVAAVLDSTPKHSRDEASVVLEGLIERSGMLREARPGAVDFIHNTFKEYLAAELFAKKADYGLLAKNALDPAWQQVLIFAAAVPSGEKGFAEKLIQQILDSSRELQATARKKEAKQQLGKDERQRNLMTVRIRSAAQFLSKELEARVDKLRSALFPPRTMAEAEALASAGDAVVPYLRYRKKDSARSVAASVRTLRLIDSDAATTRLKEYTTDPRWTVIVELAQAIEPLEIIALRRMLVQGRNLPYVVRDRVSDLSFLVLESDEFESLNLSHTLVSDLRPLAHLLNLRSLELNGTFVRDVGPLRHLKKLQTLAIGMTLVSNVAPLANLESLQSLNLYRTQVSDIAPLASLVNLQALSLGHAKISDVEPLASLVNLQTLDIGNTQVSDIEPLASLVNLQTLSIYGTPIVSLEPVTVLAGLRSLDIGNLNISDLRPLTKLKRLEHLSLEGGRGLDLEPLYEISSLKSIVLESSETWSGSASVEVTISDSIPF